VGSTIKVLCTKSKPGKPYYGNMTQLIMFNSFLPIAGLAIIVIVSFMGFSSGREDYASHPSNQPMEVNFGPEPPKNFDKDEQAKW
jgi:hypothetical protein